VHLFGFTVRKNIHDRKMYNNNNNNNNNKECVYLGFELTVFLKISAHGAH